MKTIEVTKPGGYASLVIKNEQELLPKDNEYLIDVKFIGVNYADIIVREGYYTAAKGRYPLTPGFEFSGVVSKKGIQATKYEVGDQVCGITLFGGYSTQILGSDLTIRRVPRGWSLKEAGALFVPNLTAFHAIRNVAHVKKGEIALVHSAAGGVGTALLQQLSELGCRTIAVVGSATKSHVAEQFGADRVVVKSPELWSDIDQEAPDGVDVIFDANGVTTPKPGYSRLKLGGRLVIYGFAELFPRGRRPWLPALVYRSLFVPKFRIRKLTSTNRTISGFNIAFLFERHDLASAALDYIIDAATRGIIRPPLVKSFGFNEAALAHKFMESGESIGRVVLEVITTEHSS